MRVAGARGENLYDVEDGNGNSFVFVLPKRLRHVVFIRKGSFVFARHDNTRRDGTVRGDIETVILDCHLSALQREPFWPALFLRKGNLEVSAPEVPPNIENIAQNKSASQKDTQEKGGASESESSEDELMNMGGNQNRASWAQYEASSSDDDGPQLNQA